jgi:hypothetical protein
MQRTDIFLSNYTNINTVWILHVAHQGTKPDSHELYWDATEHNLNDEEILNQPSTHYPEITYSLHKQISC